MSKQDYEHVFIAAWDKMWEYAYTTFSQTKDPNKLDNVVLDYYRRVHELKRWRLPDLDWRGQK